MNRKEFFDITWAGLRSMVDPSFAERQLIDYSEFLPQVKLVTSWATNITETEVSTAHGDQIPYDYLVVASGHIRTESDPVTRDESLLYYKEGQSLVLCHIPCRRVYMFKTNKILCHKEHHPESLCSIKASLMQLNNKE